MLSIVLCGSFVEERRYPNGELEYVLHESPSLYTLTRSVVHHVVFWSKDCWTLFFVGRNLHHWGYIDRFTGDYTAWDDYISKDNRVKHL